jgi:hypothetical protein
VPRSRSVHSACLASILGLALASFAHGPALSGETQEIYRGQENYDDPPAETRPADDPTARSAGARIEFGPYVSIQANVDSNGMNIVGDAANEPSITRNPLNPDILVIGWRQFDNISSNFRQAGWSYTVDHGETWTFPGVLTPGTFRSDPVLDYDSDGNLHYQTLRSSFDLDVFTSQNDALTWSAPIPSFGGDKNWMVVDRSGGIGDGNLYGTWQANVGCCGQNILTRSTNGNVSWEAPVAVEFSPGIGTMAIGPGGEVYSAGIAEFAGTDITNVVVSVSRNAEDPDETPTFNGTQVDLGGALGFQVTPNPAGLLGQINVQVDQNNGNVYVLGSVIPFAGPSDQADVHFIRSTDGGLNWSPFVRVNDDTPGDNEWHWMAAHAVAPNGRIDAIWNDTRNTGSPILSQLMYSFSYDEGQTWSPNVAVSPAFNTHAGWPQQNKIGDYYTLVSDDGGADVAYSATFNGEQDVYYLRLFPDCNGNGEADIADIEGPTSLDCNSNSIPDECEVGAPVCGFAGGVPDGDFIAGVPLLLGRDGGDVVLSWNPSCLPGDSDYAIYEGTIGDFSDTKATTCTTFGATSATLTPPAESTFYLVVPSNGDREGTYGKDGLGIERAPTTEACFPQLIGGCFGS